MRASMLLLLAALLLPWGTACAQAADDQLAGPVRPPPIYPPQLRSEVFPGAPIEAAATRRNHLAGAAIGMGIGALVGGVTFATLNYTKSEPSTTEYTGLSLMLGGVVGGAAGAIIGAVVGTPGRSAASENQARLRLAPGLPDGRGAASLSLELSL